MVDSRRLSMIVLTIVAIFVAVNAFAYNADEALMLLKEGNARFFAMKTEHLNINAERRMDTAINGQKPFAVVLACSDSRVPVEAIFDRGIGDIFVVRVAGNIAIDPSVIGSVEYGVRHLNSPLLVVMGHTNCGAVNASISGPPLEGDVRAIQKNIEIVAARVKKDHPALNGDSLESEVVKENILQAKKDILAGSGEIRRAAGEGKLKIVPAVYDLKTGAVKWLLE
ncbi:MAG: carbonic anhydrase [Candidatus Omnitrophica bacterium]|nr:carbonic anhydrase [Candidatus Omnitrophota bacterium]MBU0895754.1 carbonic anhydrase [Candidatus Omnitrophota bacterium]MBU1038010.1 carbonic anhydrase [Candidatus Omnitrophota bacterium]MBU1809260.1 carbonic anhydrase [Candidatus Omnitrophota bacterium]